ncbi:uncharacterized protein LOC132059349 isoform X1 [Lycium ferocissimum]|uniref:uncharacterized protein LOC132059349 isoform X1 n=1 Tax=Lycium ferocissimum TaxID=112874 RepID=UPI0028152E5F|nr:uncharacterized protein LOC132059349 isoform X1 [Lycium ferocissimum]
MQVIHRWRNVLMVKDALIQSTRIVASTQSQNTHLASFHSTSICSQKWKNKFNSEFRGSQPPTKDYIRYATRQKRADSKKALKNLLFYGASGNSFESESSTIDDRWDVDRDDRSEKKSEYKSAARRRDRLRRRMRKMKKRRLSEDFEEYPETVFQATFGNKWYTWCSRPGKSSPFEDLFSRRQETDWSEQRHCRWDNETENETQTESNYESFNVGSYSERTILGLPPRGPLKIEDVKNAFRLSALKWHPDKHQGPSQVSLSRREIQILRHCIQVIVQRALPSLTFICSYSSCI